MRRAAVLALLLLFAFPTLADTDIALPPNTYPIGLAAAADGTLWYAAAGAEIGRVLPTGEVQRVRLSWPFVLEGRAAVVVAPDGAAYVGDVNGQIARVDANMNATTIALNQSGTSFTHVKDMTLAADGRVWFVAAAYATPPFLGRVNADLTVDRFPMPEAPSAIAAAPDGSLYVAGSDRLYRATTAGALTAVANCMYCGSRWLAVAPDGTVWSSSGRLTPDGTFVRHSAGRRDATIGPDGNVWTAPDTNALRAYGEDGALVREVPFLDPDDEPLSITSFDGTIWYGVRNAIRGFDPRTRMDLRLRLGDVVTVEMEPNCCFEGWHPVLAFHRRGGPRPFVRRIERAGGDPYDDGGVYAIDATRIVVEGAILDGDGTPHASLAGLAGSSGSGVVVDRAGRIHEIRRPLEGGAPYRLLTYGPGGSLLRDVPLPVSTALEIAAVDLAADQCTLVYAAEGVRRLDICTGALLADLVPATTEFPRDLRILPDGHVLVVYGNRLVRHRPDGTVAQQFDAPEDDPFTAVALDRDPAYVWIGANELRRMHLATGAIVERREVYGRPRSISVIGEPRAARTPTGRRLGVRRLSRRS